MAPRPLVDAGFLVALLSRRDANHRWAAAQAQRFPPPWTTCEAVLSETCHLLGGRGTRSLASLLRRDALVCAYRFADDMDAVLKWPADCMDCASKGWDARRHARGHRGGRSRTARRTPCGAGGPSGGSPHAIAVSRATPRRIFCRCASYGILCHSWICSRACENRQCQPEMSC
jgi:hypothetical protein